ncbi:hypothetical protein Tco_0731476 [Tanacetum coccineum]
MLTECGDGVASIKRRRCDLSSDGVRKLTTVSGHDEVTGLVEEYVIPLDLHPRALSLVLTMNNLTLYENVIDLRPVHLTMLYEIVLTTIWKHVGYHSTFKDSEGNVVASMSGFLKFPMAHGVQIGHGTVLRPNKVIVENTTPLLLASTLILAKLDFQRVVEHGYERILVAKEKKKSQEGQNKEAGKRPRRVGAPVCTKKRKTTPLSMTTSSILNDAKQRRVYADLS